MKERTHVEKLVHFTVDNRGCTKAVPILQCAKYIRRIKRKPQLSASFSLGDVGRKEDMVKATAEAISRLWIGDCAWMRRSDNEWTYSRVRAVHDGTVTFQVDYGKKIKTVPATADNVMLVAKESIVR